MKNDTYLRTCIFCGEGIDDVSIPWDGGYCHYSCLQDYEDVRDSELNLGTKKIKEEKWQ